LGVIGVGTTDPKYRYNQSDLTLLNLFAQQAAIAVENARLFEEIKSRAVTDELTGLYNRRGLFELGKIEVERAIRYQRPLSVILFDIDHFKLVNDRYSHAVGDQVLRQLAELCRRTVRASDIVGRYGGEEFAVVLPETRLEEAQQVAERFRLAAEEITIPINNKMPTLGNLKVTISCGVMCAEHEIPELAVLIDRADTALYNAKMAGRNRTETFPVKQSVLNE
jgi:diguanylate cyclase (GGDEF)-like protein